MINSLARLKAIRRHRMLLALPVAAAAAVVVLAACGTSGSSSGGSSGGPYSSAASSTPAAGAPAGAVALTLRHTSLGTILTNGQGFTLYAFEADKGTMSACSGACAAAWPAGPHQRRPRHGYRRRRQAPGRGDHTGRRPAAAHLRWPPTVQVQRGRHPGQHQRAGLGSVRRPMGHAHRYRHRGDRWLAPNPGAPPPVVSTPITPEPAPPTAEVTPAEIAVALPIRSAPEPHVRPSTRSIIG